MASISDATTLGDDHSMHTSSDTITNNGSIHNFAVLQRKAYLNEKKEDTIMEAVQISSEPGGSYKQYKFVNTDHARAVCIMDRRLNDPITLYNYITRSCHTSLKPEPTIRIQGSHTYSTGGKDSTTETEHDFRIHIPFNMEDPVVRIQTANEGCVHRRNRRSDTGDLSAEACEDGPSLMQWCERFCKSTWSLRVLRIETRIQGVDTEYLKNELCKQIRDTGYRGGIRITFPVVGGMTNGIDIYNHCWFHSLRQTWFWRLLTFISGITGTWLIWALGIYPFIVFATQYWDVCVVTWETGLDIRGEPCDAHEWLTQYSQLVKDLVLGQTFGNAAHLLKHGTIRTPGIPKRNQTRIVDNSHGVTYNRFTAKPGDWGHNGVYRGRRYV